jgi:hypothetical protein
MRFEEERNVQDVWMYGSLRMVVVMMVTSAIEACKEVRVCCQ